jgi:hypothetical protein
MPISSWRPCFRRWSEGGPAPRQAPAASAGCRGESCNPSRSHRPSSPANASHWRTSTPWRWARATATELRLQSPRSSKKLAAEGSGVSWGQPCSRPASQGPLPGHPGLHPRSPVPQPARAGQQLLRPSQGQAIERPGVAPASPAGQALRCPEGVAQPQARHRQQLGEAADHHQVGVARQQRNQRLRLPAGHQRQEGLITDHQREPGEQRLQGGRLQS